MIDYKKIVRLFIYVSLFLCFGSLVGLEQRQAHHILFVNLGIMLFALLLDNIYLTLFVWWTVFLFIFFKCNIGWGYVIAILAGSIYYLLTKISFEKRHIEKFFDILLWIGVANLFYAIVQVCGYDWFFNPAEHLTRSRPDSLVIQAPYGFMGNTGIAAYFYATLGCILASKTHRLSLLTGSLMFIPIFFLHASTSFVALAIAVMFILFFRMKRKYWVGIVILLSILTSCFIWKIDPIGTERFNQWKMVMRDYMVHPVTGWGLDSFKNTAPGKNFIYAMSGAKINGVMHANEWDNPHNLYISLLYEFGIVGLILFGTYLVKMAKVFKDAIKDYDNLALAGCLLIFLIVSIGQFPIFMGRCAVFIIPMFALLEVSTK